MHKQMSFPLRLGEQNRRRARKLAQKMGLSENRLYSDLIQEGLLVREQMNYFEKLRSARVPSSGGLALLNLAPDVPPAPEDVLPEGDNHLIELAVAGSASAIVTNNVKDLRSGELLFPSIRVLTPADLLN